MKITCQRAGQVKLFEDESYRLNVNESGIKLEAVTDIGALRGMETFLQLVTADEKGYYLPAVEINDAPRFPWRGLLIDACRHFMPVEVIKRNLDGMAAVKLNVMHWHLSEDQGFRVECKTWPKLHEIGSDGDYYTQDQIRDIIRYAGDRGIRVVPEFDLPGHATSWLAAYPEYASLPGPYSVERGWGVCDPTFNPAKEETYQFLDAFFKEMAQLFTDEYMHIGGDENNGNQWNANPDIQAFMKKNKLADNHALQAYFNQRLLKILAANGKKMIGWDEILHPDLPKNIVIQSWRGGNFLVEASAKGYQTMLSNGYYIDLIQPTDYHYLNDPYPEGVVLTDAQKKLILGGEATMWAESVNWETVDSRIWPRTAAIAERLWSPAFVKDVDDMYRRLETVSFRLEELGLTHEKNYAMMLRRLTNNGDTHALRALVDVIEPVKIYQRNQLREHYQQSPLTRVVDAARPDQKTARHFRNLVDRFIKSRDAQFAMEIESWLILWRDNHSRLLHVISKNPALLEIETLSSDLAEVSVAGLEALQLILEKKGGDEQWREEKLALVKKAQTPHGQAELMILPAIGALILAAK
jgi:hexosaminidase